MWLDERLCVCVHGEAACQKCWSKLYSLTIRSAPVFVCIGPRRRAQAIEPLADRSRSPPRGRGSDRNGGLNPGDPVRSLAKALDVANTTPGRNQVLVTLGSFTGSGLTVSTPVSIYGGYSLTFAGRGTTRSVFSSTSAVALTYSGIGDRTTLDRMTIQAANQTAPGAESGAVAVAHAGGFLTIRNALLRAGTGGLGSNGAPGVSGASGNTGVTGGAGCDGNCSGRTGATAGASPGGGGGGRGPYRGSGDGGAAGAPNGSSCGGSGGAASGKARQPRGDQPHRIRRCD
jgi:hypothetical protein